MEQEIWYIISVKIKELEEKVASLETEIKKLKRINMNTRLSDFQKMSEIILENRKNN